MGSDFCIRARHTPKAGLLLSVLFSPLEFHLHLAILRGFPGPHWYSKEVISLFRARQPNATSVYFVPWLCGVWLLTEAFPPAFAFLLKESSTLAVAKKKKKVEFESSKRELTLSLMGALGDVDKQADSRIHCQKINPNPDACDWNK